MKENITIASQILITRIVEETQNYEAAIKNGKVFHEVKDIRRKIKNAIDELKELMVCEQQQKNGDISMIAK